ncbi:hypothetical protein CEW87_02480 [Parazoarcus communis]|uniref:Haloacid dehalogenase n=1 Tax=Parazoarcus communis TaxID=41977 RepID=A0A2U8H0T1_9RHOO|nr:hypothetical protein CEW87_02480 [Parazoarcus communis]
MFPGRLHASGQGTHLRRLRHTGRLARDYKPKPVVYLAAAGAFDLEPGETMMVAAHTSDLAAAAAAGLRTAFIARPDEYGPGMGETTAGTTVDVSCASLLELAAALEA